MYNKNGSWKYHFYQCELNVNIYKCFRTGASQSKHNMCGSRNFYQGGSRPDGKKTALTVFFSVCFVCPQPINRGIPVVLFQRESKNVNFYRNPYITCDFLSPPLDPRMHDSLYSSFSSLLKCHRICNRQYLFVLLAIGNHNIMWTVHLHMIHIWKCQG